MNKREFIENFIFYGIIVAIAYVCCKYLLPIMIPFIIGYVIAYIAHEVSKKSTKDMNQAKKVVILIAIYIVMIIVGFFVVAYLVDKVKDLVGWISTYSAYIEPTIADISNAIASWSAELPASAEELMGSLTSAALEGLKNVVLVVAGALSSFVTNLVTSIPSLFLSIVVAIISSFYILVDYDRVNNSLSKMVPNRLKGVTSSLVVFVKTKLFRIIKSYIVIMGLTCVELIIGLVICGTPNALLLAVLISILDILPVLGVGTALIPWAVVDMILGNVFHGIMLLIVYIAITVIRNIVEPKLVGEDLGLDPLTTLVAMIVGMQLFGILGLFGIPLVLSFVLYLNENKKNEAKKI